MQGRVLPGQGEQSLGDLSDDRVDPQDVAVLGAPDVVCLEHQGGGPDHPQEDLGPRVPSPGLVDGDDEILNG